MLFLGFTVHFIGKSNKTCSIDSNKLTWIGLNTAVNKLKASVKYRNKNKIRKFVGK